MIVLSDKMYHDKMYHAFSQIEASPELKESTLRYLQEERGRRGAKSSSVQWRRAIAVICAVFIVCAGVGGYGYYMMQVPVSYVSIDVNPSIELTLNCFDRVIAVAAYNEDAEGIVGNLDVKGMLYDKAVDFIAETDAMQPYLDGENILVLTVASSNGAKCSSLLANLKKCRSYSENSGHGYSADVGLLSEAHEHDMSFGKYEAYCVLSEYDDTISVEDCHDMSMSEIHSRINEHESCSNGCSGAGMDAQGSGGHHGPDGDNGNGHGCH